MALGYHGPRGGTVFCKRAVLNPDSGAGDIIGQMFYNGIYIKKGRGVPLWNRDQGHGRSKT
jgi:hypothetical protein